MCNRQCGIIVASTAAILLLLVTTAALVFHYVYSQKTENIPSPKMQILSELPQYKDIDFTSCKCQQSEENCETEIDFHISLEIQKEEFCTKDKILCCKLKKNLHWDKIVHTNKEMNNYKNDGGEENAVIEETDTMKGLAELSNELSLSKYLDSNHCKCQSSDVECDKVIHIPQLISIEMVSYCPHPNILCCNIKDDLTIEKENPQAIYEKNITDIHEEKNQFVRSTNLNSDSKSNQSLDIVLQKYNEGDESLLSNFILETLFNQNKEVNISEVSAEVNLSTTEMIADLPEVNSKKSGTAENDLHKDNAHLKSHKIHNNNKGKKSLVIEANELKLDNLIKKNEGKGNVSLLDESNLYGMVEDLNNINFTSSVSELGNSNSISDTLYTSIDSVNDGVNLYDMMEDLNMFNFTPSKSKPGNSDSSLETLHASVNADNSVLNLLRVDQSHLSLDEFNSYNMNDNLNIFNFSSPMPEPDNSYSTSDTLYTSIHIDNSKSKPFTDYIFYYSYLIVFLYVISFMVGFLIPVFSITGLAINLISIFGFPHIIQSQVLDIASPVLKAVYACFGLL